MNELFYKKKIINVVDDQIGIPTTSDFIADIVFKLININFEVKFSIELLMEKPAGTNLQSICINVLKIYIRIFLIYR